MERIAKRLLLPFALVLGVAALAIGSPASGAVFRQVQSRARSAPSTMRVGYADPIRDRSLLPLTAGQGVRYTSRNWDGYSTYTSSEGTDFNEVQSTWVQPSVTCPKPNAWTVFWVGLDGFFSNTVEQGGSSAECVNGTPQYETWWEMFPTNDIQTVFSISPGDSMSANVTYDTADATYVITVKDLTSGQSFTRDEQCASNLTCERSSAEVIAEDVGAGSDTFYPLADYGKMTFNGASITNTAGDTGSFTDPLWDKASIKEASAGVTYATISKLTAKGTSFNAKWQHS